MYNKVLVATSCRAENARFVDFYRMRDELIVPEGSEKRLFPGFFPDYNINDAVKKALLEDFTHLFIVDDDQILPPDTLLRLLQHNLDIVGVNLLSRTAPFSPYFFDEATEDGFAKPQCLNGEGPLIEKDVCGTGGLLVKTSVFTKVAAPWFAHDDKVKTYDFYFCREARKAGFKIHVDLSCPSGHMVIASVWPKRVNGQWMTTIIVNNSIELNIPAATRNEEGNLVIGGTAIEGKSL